MKKVSQNISAIILALFGLITLFLSTSIYLDLFGIRAKEGNYVLFVVIANFICSILYLFAAYGFTKNKRWTTNLLVISSIILSASLLGLFVHINSGGLYETKTIPALLFRISVTVIFTTIAYFTISINKSNEK